MENGLKGHLWTMEGHFGCKDNEECKIDSIAQSWSVISGAGDMEKVEEAMSSLEHYLINKDVRNNQVIRSTI